MGKRLPPRWANRILHRFCHADLLPEIEGDLHELYQRWVEEYGVRKARWLYAINVITFLRPFAIKRKQNKFSHPTNHSAMLRNYFIIAVRNLQKNKAFSFINILGLAIGMAACLLIVQYVRFELSYDQFHEKADRVYRVQHDRYMDGELQYQKAQSFIPTGEAMMDEYPEVLNYTTLFPISAESDIVVTYDAKNDETMRFAEENVYHVKGNFFNLFSLPIVDGPDDVQALSPNTVLISASVAQKYFGDASPVGQTISHNYAEDYQVIGVFADPPVNTHLKPDFLFAWQPIDSKEKDQNNWRWDGFYTYLLLAPEANAQTLEAKLPDFIEKHKVGRANTASQFSLQPLTDIHLYSHLQGETEPNGEASIVYSLLGVGLFILLIAFINYVNLSTARSIDRAKEIGVRKAVGSGKSEIIRQFLVEALVVNLLAVVAALAIVQLLYASFSDLTGISTLLTITEKLVFWTIAIFLLFGGSLAAGWYPAWVIANLEPVRALKGKLGTPSRESFFNLRHSLVIFQFATSIALMMGSLVVYQQLRFMKAQQLGINMDHTLVVNTNTSFGPPGADSLFVSELNVLKNQLASYSTVAGVTASTDVPGREHLINSPIFQHTKNPEQRVSLYFSRIDRSFLPTFRANVIAGRNFLPTDQNAILLNEEALRVLGFVEPLEAVGEEIHWGTELAGKGTVVGVVDFRATSFKSINYPVVYTTDYWPLKYLSVKFNNIDDENATESIALVESAWEKVFPDTPFEYFFLDDLFNRQYQAEQKFSQLLGVFTLLAILVACLGLYAIASLTIIRRTKEVGIRKVLGASAQSMVGLLSQEFFILVLIASALALPVAFWGTSLWLENYAFRITIHWWLLVLPIVAVLLVTLLTISIQTIKAALANPVDSLRYE